MNVLFRVKDLTGWNDRDLADMVGLSRVTVNRVLKGHVPENLSPAAKTVLRQVLTDFADEIQQVVSYIDLTS